MRFFISFSIHLLTTFLISGALVGGVDTTKTAPFSCLLKDLYPPINAYLIGNELAKISDTVKVLEQLNNYTKKSKDLLRDFYYSLHDIHDTVHTVRSVCREYHDFFHIRSEDKARVIGALMRLDQYKKNTLLSYAIEEKSVPLARVFLESYSDANGHMGGIAFLFKSLDAGPEMVRALLAFDANPNVRD